MLAIGLMSGTSLDGVDAALVMISKGKFKLIKFITYPYDELFKAKIMRNLNDDTAKLSEVSSLNFELGDYFVKAIDMLLDDTEYHYCDISFVSSHGQTIWHDPLGNKYPIDREVLSKQVPSTLQIGSASVINYKTKIKVVSNFRCKDICAGGEGAPLVPFSEYYLYKKKNKSLIFQNIGGISNLTFIPKGGSINDVISFDNGVGNIMIDYFTKKYFNLPFDNNGDIARKGSVINELYEYLKKDEYTYKLYPKSTGREQYSVTFMENLASMFEFDKHNKYDIICTITMFTAFQISYSYLHNFSNIDLVIVSGGGSHNGFLMDEIRKMSKQNVITGDEYGINSDAKEALAFVVLGYMTLHNRPSNVMRATGAKEEVILGDITI